MSDKTVTFTLSALLLADEPMGEPDLHKMVNIISSAFHYIPENLRPTAFDVHKDLRQCRVAYETAIGAWTLTSSGKNSAQREWHRLDGNYDPVDLCRAIIQDFPRLKGWRMVYPDLDHWINIDHLEAQPRRLERLPRL